MIYDYIIFGLGPTGITLGLNLMKTNKKVLFIEADNKIGGCWKTNFTNDGYFTEHSPKVLSKSGSKEFNKLLRYLKVIPKYKKVYADSNLYKDHLVGIVNEFSWKDIMHFSVSFFSFQYYVDTKAPTGNFFLLFFFYFLRVTSKVGVRKLVYVVLSYLFYFIIRQPSSFL